MIAYTFDAGPHGFLFVHEDMLSEVLNYLFILFGSQSDLLNEKAKQILNKKKEKWEGFSDYKG